MRQYFRPEYLEVLAYYLMPNHYHMLLTLHRDEVSQKVMPPWQVFATPWPPVPAPPLAV